MSVLSFGQAPNGIHYQAVVRNSDGSIRSNSDVNVVFVITSSAFAGDTLYAESHFLTTNSIGIVACTIGYGSNIISDFSQISWGSGEKYLHVQIDGINVSSQIMLSVPYAIYANGINMEISPIGDTLTIGKSRIIVPGISAANPRSISDFGSELMPNNSLCADQFIGVTACGGVTEMDYQGQNYSLVEIGGQCWFAENLKVDHYRNGDSIPVITNSSLWSTTSTGACIDYNLVAQNSELYGKLYNWFVVNDSRGICPVGWHVPSDCDWMYLENFLGMSLTSQLSNGFRGSNQGGQLKQVANWSVPNVGATNSTAFQAVPGGYRSFNGLFLNQGELTFWWTSTQSDTYFSIYRRLSNSSASISRGSFNKRLGFSLRCVRD
jgi:uncharacterized protein (TIGR02145 family)